VLIRVVHHLKASTLSQTCVGSAFIPTVYILGFLEGDMDDQDSMNDPLAASTDLLPQAGLMCAAPTLSLLSSLLLLLPSLLEVPLLKLPWGQPIRPWFSTSGSSLSLLLPESSLLLLLLPGSSLLVSSLLLLLLLLFSLLLLLLLLLLFSLLLLLLLLSVLAVLHVTFSHASSDVRLGDGAWPSTLPSIPSSSSV